MANESGSSAPSKAAEKSGNKSGAQVQQMLVKRQAEATQASRAEPVKAEPVKTEEAPQTTAPSEEVKTSPQEKKAEPEPKVIVPEVEEMPSDEVLSKLSPEQKERIERRIGKEVAKRKSLEAEISRLRTLANATPQVIPQPVAQRADPADGPLAGVTDPAEVQRRADEALEVKDWAQSQLDNEVTEARLGGVVYDRAALRNAVRNSDKFITRDVPKQLTFIQDKAKADRQTAELFGSESWMGDRSSEGYQAYLQILRDPAIAKRPNATWIAAVQVQGLIDVQRRMQSTGKKAEPIVEQAKARAPGSQTASGGGFGPTRESGSSKAVAALEADLEKLRGKRGVTGRDVENYFRKMEDTRTR